MASFNITLTLVVASFAFISMSEAGVVWRKCNGKPRNKDLRFLMVTPGMPRDDFKVKRSCVTACLESAKPTPAPINPAASSQLVSAMSASNFTQSSAVPSAPGVVHVHSVTSGPGGNIYTLSVLVPHPVGGAPDLFPCDPDNGCENPGEETSDDEEEDYLDDIDAVRNSA